jgi:hypothetical protein
MRGRPPTYSRRYHLTLEPAEADVLDAYAREQAKPPATVAARLLATALRRATAGEEDELASAHRQLEQLRTANAAMRRRMSEVNIDAMQEPPRWERPMPDLLSDREWWAAWLPRLYQLFGRQQHAYRTSRVEALDIRGYPDLLNHLFPAVLDRGGRVLAEWSSPFYPDHARRAWEAAQSGDRLAESGATSDRAGVWEPVVRHVAAALCALEMTATPGADPLLRFRVEDELAGGWLRTLHRLTGTEAADLPDLPS